MTTLEVAASISTPAEPVAGYRWRWVAMSVILTGSVMELLDATIINIAGPTMRDTLGGSASTIQWFGAAYTLAMMAGLLLGGRLGDMYGRRTLFTIGATGFVIGSLLCAVATSPEVFIGARVIQGLFGAAMIPQALGLIKEMFPPKEIQTAFGLFGPVMALSTVGGPLLAGWMVDANFFGAGWRMIFLINVPIGVATILGAWRFMPRSRSQSELKLDVLGAVLACVAGVLLVYPLVQGREHGWPAWTFAMVAASVVTLVIFGWYESRKGKAGGDPLVVPSLFRRRAFTGGMVVGLMMFAVLVGFGLVFTLYLQIGLGYAPLKAALVSLPMSIGMVVGMVASPSLKRFGRKALHAGTAVCGLGLVAVLLTIQTGESPWRLVVPLALTGAGLALMMGPFFEFVLAGVQPHETGSAAGVLTSVQQLGAAFGIALLGTVFFGIGESGTAAAFHQAVVADLWVVIGLLVIAAISGFALPKRVDENPTRTLGGTE